MILEINKKQVIFMQVLLVMAGGFLGAVVRFALSDWLYAGEFPLNTLIINLAGCLFLGWFLTFVSQSGKLKPGIALLIGTGFTGSFTTFSTFSLEAMNLLQQGFAFQVILYIIASTGGGLLLAYAGFKLAVFHGRSGADDE